MSRKQQIKRARDKKRKYLIEYLKQNSCVDCGESDIVVLEFDHVKGEKFKTVWACALQNESYVKLKKEIEKCEVVCANCHRRRTYKRAKRFHRS